MFIDDTHRKKSNPYGPSDDRDFDIDLFDMLDELIQRAMENELDKDLHISINDKIVINIYDKDKDEQKQKRNKKSFQNNPLNNRLTDVKHQEQKPFIDINEYNDYVSITLEVFGVEKNKVDIRVVDYTLIIGLDNTPPFQYERFDFPYNVDPKSIAYSIHHGILDIEIRKI